MTILTTPTASFTLDTATKTVIIKQLSSQTTAVVAVKDLLRLLQDTKLSAICEYGNRTKTLEYKKYNKHLHSNGIAINTFLTRGYDKQLLAVLQKIDNQNNTGIDLQNQQIIPDYYTGQYIIYNGHMAYYNNGILFVEHNPPAKQQSKNTAMKTAQICPVNTDKLPWEN